MKWIWRWFKKMREQNSNRSAMAHNSDLLTLVFVF
jgi:hypothetical protein